MSRSHKLLGCMLLALAAAAGSEETIVPAATLVDVAKAETGGWPVALKPGPLLVKVVFADGRIVEKCWAEVFSQGAWVVLDGTFCWYLRESLREVTILDEEPDEALAKSLENAISSRKAELARQREADEARERARAEAAKEAPVAQVASAAAQGPEAGKGTGAGPIETANARPSGPLDAARGGADLAGVADGGRSTGSGGGGHNRGHIHGVNDHDLNLLVQWRVKGLNREGGTVTLRNRGLKHIVTLEVEDPDDLDHVKRNDILLGSLNPTEPKLTAKDGTIVEFQPIAAVP